jgi:hypothetical protein
MNLQQKTLRLGDLFIKGRSENKKALEPLENDRNLRTMYVPSNRAAASVHIKSEILSSAG